ncbi:hypothetical protein K7X08_021696 [Anisodus acutangulus]|uniref:Uncharacterized protein n=1 Tax=Anisodus acutangulus TaxID=402998 RepID=A0A9Q1RE38_9SOLA|nr:hypothetical protein K7X08_021696 [Anisodus acutangulus]
MKSSRFQKSNEKTEQGNRQVVMIKDSGELQVDIFKGEWEDVPRKHTRKESGNKRGSRTKDTNNEQAIAITQNSFDELMEETKIQISDVSKHEQTPRKGHKKGKPQDEWVEISSSSSEEVDSLENTSEEEDDQKEEEPNIEKNTKKDTPANGQSAKTVPE